MKQYQYKVYCHTHAHDSNLEDVLNCLGREGWQLVQTSGGSLFYFMKELPEAKCPEYLK